MNATFLWELRRRKWFTFWWSLGVAVLIAVNIYSYLAVKDQAKSLDKAFGELSSSIGSFVGSTDLFSPVGYLSSQIYYIMLPLLLIIMVITLVSSLVAKDENDLTVELILARPISRGGLLGAKALAGLSIIAIVALSSFAITFVSAKAAGLDVATNYLLLTHLLSFAFSVSFGVVSFALMAYGGLGKKIANVVAIILSFGGYMITSLSAFVDWLEPVSKALPYHYYNTSEILTGTVQTGLYIYLVLVAILGVAVAWAGYRGRDIG